MLFYFMFLTFYFSCSCSWNYFIIRAIFKIFFCLLHSFSQLIFLSFQAYLSFTMPALSRNGKMQRIPAPMLGWGLPKVPYSKLLTLMIDYGCKQSSLKQVYPNPVSPFQNSFLVSSNSSMKGIIPTDEKLSLDDNIVCFI